MFYRVAVIELIYSIFIIFMLILSFLICDKHLQFLFVPIFITFFIFKIFYYRNLSVLYVTPQFLWLIPTFFYFLIPYIFLNQYLTHKFSFSTINNAIFFLSICLIMYNIGTVMTNLFMSIIDKKWKRYAIKIKQYKYFNFMFISFIGILASMIKLFIIYKEKIIALERHVSISGLVYNVLDLSTFLVVFMIYFYLLNHGSLKSKSYKLIAFFSVTVMLIPDFLYGSKALIIIKYFLSYFFIYYIVNRKISIKLIVISLIAFISYFPFAIAIRFHKHEIISWMDLLYIYKTGIEFFSLDLLKHIVGRLNIIGPFIDVFDLSQYYRDFFLSHYPNNNTLFPLFLMAFIPKILWKERPETSIGGMLGYSFGFINSPDESFIATSIFSEFLINFGFYGGIIASFLLGTLHQFISMYILKKISVSFINIFIYYYFIIFVIILGLQAYFVKTLVIFIKNCVVFFVLYVIMIKSVKLLGKLKL